MLYLLVNLLTLGKKVEYQIINLSVVIFKGESYRGRFIFDLYQV